MKRIAIASIGLLACIPALAENVEGVDEIICSAADVKLCFETGECFDASPWELDMPEFVIIDARKKTVSTTEASGQKRSTAFSAIERSEGLIYMQGIENGRAFSFVIDELTGILTASIARDGISVTVFGACTDADI